MGRVEDLLRLNFIDCLLNESNRIYTILVGEEPIYEIFSLT